MNQDQIINLIQTFGKVGGGLVAGYGAEAQSFWTALVGVIVAGVSWYFSHRSNAAATTTPKPNTGILGALFVIVSLAVGLSACSTSQTKTAYQVESGASIGVTTAMSAWGAYVGVKQPGTNAEYKVWQAWTAYKTAELAAIAATESLATSPTNTPALQQAISAAMAAEQASATNLVSLITSLGVTLK